MKAHRVYKAGYTLMEVMIVIVIMSILFIAGVNGYNTAVNNAKIDACETDLRTFSQAFSAYMMDFGRVEFTEAEINSGLAAARMTEILDIMNRNYLPVKVVFESDTKVITSDDRKGVVELITQNKKDPWGKKYHIYINTLNSTQTPAGLIVVRSFGTDGQKSSKGDPKGHWGTDLFGDDVLVAISPNEY